LILELKDRFLPPAGVECSYDHLFYWVGHPASSRPAGSTGDSAKDAYNALQNEFIANRDKLEILGGVTDPNACYDYDEFAVVRYKRKLYLLETSGCSCPSPSETWGIVHGPTTKTELVKSIKKGDYQGYTLPEWAEAELLAAIEST
jgi:hypothetical protein